MILIYWWIVRLIEWFEKVERLSNSPNTSSHSNQREETSSGFVWIDHFYNDNGRQNDNQGGHDNANDDSFNSPDW